MPRRDKEKNREYQRKWYKKNRELQIARNKANKRGKYEWFREYKKKLACIICGENHPATLDFHHRNPKYKEGNLAAVMSHNLSLENIIAEIEKCDVLCSNCHRKLHYELKERENLAP
jgi:hypothetical protein